MARLGPRQLTLAGVRVDLDRREYVREGETGTLSPTEAKLLDYLAAAKGPVSKAQLLEEVWGYRPGVISRTLDTTLGRLRKKLELDPKRPKHLLTVPDQGYAFRPLSTQQSKPSPLSLTPFLGRQAEMAEVDTLLSSGARLITILGEGGAGKTTLLQAMGRQRGVAIVRLEEARECAEVLAMICSTHGLDPLLEPSAIAAHLGARAPLLLLDNLEQLTPGVEEPILALLTHAPTLQVLSTSRVPIGIKGEVTVPLGPLPESEARALFLTHCAERRQVQDDPALSELLAALHGLPLAIELAAARTSLLSVQELNARLKHPLGLLKGGQGPTRHQSIAQSLQWSWSLLEPEQQGQMSALALFAGGFTLKAAQTLLGADPHQALELLQRQAWLHRVPEHDRLTLRPAVRDFVRELAPSSAEQRAAHARCYAAYGDPEWIQSLDLEGGQRRKKHQEDYYNFVQAARWAARNDAPELWNANATAAFEAARLSRPLQTCLSLGCPDQGGSSAQRAWLRMLRGEALYMGARPDQAREEVGQALREAQEHHVPVIQLRARLLLALLAREASDQARSLELLHQARQIEDIDLASRAMLLVHLGLNSEAPQEEKISMLEEAVRCAHQAGHTRLEANALGDLGWIYLVHGDRPRAREALNAAMRLHLALNNTRRVGLIRINLAVESEIGGFPEQAVAGFEEALTFLERTGHRRLELEARRNLINVLRRSGQRERALAEANKAKALAEETDLAAWKLELQAVALELAPEATAGARRQAAVVLGRAKQAHRRQVQIGTLTLRGRLLLASGDPAAAGVVLAEAQHLTQGLSGRSLGHLAIEELSGLLATWAPQTH